MRVYLLWLIILFLCFYSLRDYFKPTCFLVLLMAVYGHPDMPTNVAGVQGLNPWNLLMIFCLIGYLTNKRREGARWDLDGGMTLLLSTFVIISLISSTRLLLDFDTLIMYDDDHTRAQIVSEYFVNQHKWLIPGYLMFAGARTVERRRLALMAIIGVHVLIALIVIRRVPPSSVESGMQLTKKGLKVLEQAFGWSRVNTAMLLAGGAWAALFSIGHLTGGRFRWLPITVFGVISVALALTGGRMGWGAWVVLGVVFSLWRWRKGIVLLPALALIIVIFVPAVQQRLLQGISTDADTTQIENPEELTSGRTIAWPVVLEEIARAPWTGYGGLAMKRTGASVRVAQQAGIPEGERSFPHPHNAYLSLLLDTGIIGAIPVLLLYLVILARAVHLGRSEHDEARTAGTVTVALLLALMVAGIGSQYFYPVQGNIALWASIGLTLRIYTDMPPRRRPADSMAWSTNAYDANDRVMSARN